MAGRWNSYWFWRHWSWSQCFTKKFRRTHQAIHFVRLFIWSDLITNYTSVYYTYIFMMMIKENRRNVFYYCWNCEWTTDVKAYFFNVSVLLKLIAKLKKLFPLHIQNIIAKHITTILHFQFILKQCKLRPTILSFILRQKYIIRNKSIMNQI